MNAITNFIEDKIIMGKLKLNKAIESFLSEERGDTNFVSIMIIIAIVLVVAAIFRKQLIAIVTNVMNNVTEFTESTGE